MSRKVHAVEKHATDLYPAVVSDSMQQSMTGMANSAGGGLCAVSTVVKVISPRGRSAIRAFPAAGAFGIISHV